MKEKIFEGTVIRYLDDLGHERFEIVDDVSTIYDSDCFEYDISKYKGKKVIVTIEVVGE
ncbi:hypothetical protein [Oceanobacillus sp. J11TS1]|uniref:hypothetical protein n=1 Tax=Oceanobacillus sp. J11TS1 TaxID=2807191 RepID=UPI001B11DA71|nr:hypothetical protein [Oceanobacillus sp. J11TS1]GIO22439.1 hypothetical protein J11TS1_10200 [Oceanobacillus sp. J11TS1]